MAEKAAMSVRNFSRLFASDTGLGPAKFLKKSRLEAAVAAAMAYQRCLLTTVARNCGFSNLDQFCKAFRRHYGVSPQDFRDRSY